MDLSFSGGNIVELIAAGSVAVKGYMGYLAAQGNGENMDGDVFSSKRKIQILIQRFHASFPPVFLSFSFRRDKFSCP